MNTLFAKDAGEECADKPVTEVYVEILAISPQVLDLEEK